MAHGKGWRTGKIAKRFQWCIPVPVSYTHLDRNITFYVIREGAKKVIYACCNPKPFAHNDLYFDADVLIISLVSDDGILGDGTELKDAPFKDEIFTLGEVMELKKYYRIKRIIAVSYTHLNHGGCSAQFCHTHLLWL